MPVYDPPAPITVGLLNIIWFTDTGFGLHYTGRFSEVYYIIMSPLY
jgi:hypothetical protein